MLHLLPLRTTPLASGLLSQGNHWSQIAREEDACARNSFGLEKTRSAGKLLVFYKNFMSRLLVLVCYLSLLCWPKLISNVLVLTVQ